jgi:hypothetical protein
MSFIHLFYDRGWDVYWNPRDGRMYAKKEGLLIGTSHHFTERTRDRISAIAVAKAWLRG